MRIYLNTSALNRPFDDQSSERVRDEAKSVIALISTVERRRVELVSSDYLRFEISQNPDPERAGRVSTLASMARHHVRISDDVAKRALELEVHGLRGLDALHISAAESGGARLLVTTDDRMLQRARKASLGLRVRVLRPAEALRAIEEENHP